MVIVLFLFVYLSRQLRVANENEEQLRADCMKYKEVLESRSSAVTVSTFSLLHSGKVWHGIEFGG